MSSRGVRSELARKREREAACEKGAQGRSLRSKPESTHLVALDDDDALSLAYLLSRSLEPRHDLPLGHGAAQGGHEELPHFRPRHDPLRDGPPLPSDEANRLRGPRCHEAHSYFSCPQRGRARPCPPSPRVQRFRASTSENLPFLFLSHFLSTAFSRARCGAFDFERFFRNISNPFPPERARREPRSTDRTRMAPFLGPQALTRMHRELRMLETEPPPGVSAWPKDENKIHEVSGREPTALAALSPLADLSGTDYLSNVPRRSARGRDPGPSGHGVRGGILPAQRHRPVKVSAAPTLSCSKDDKNTLWTDSLSISRTLWFARRAGTRSSPPASSSLRRSTTRTSTRREGYASTR